MRGPGQNTRVSQGVTDAVAIGLWVWIFGFLAGILAAFWVAVYNFYRSGVVPDPTALVAGLDATQTLLLVGGAAGAIGLLLLTLLNVTFGERNVDAAIDQGDELEQAATDGGNPTTEQEAP